MPYPTAHPDVSVFEPMTEEYAAVSTPGAHSFTPLSSSDTLASLVLNGDFQAAESLRKEMISHRIPIPHDILYLRAALHAITMRRPKGCAKERLDAFEAWLSLAPDRNEEWHAFHDIRQRLFLSMDHLNLTLVYRFGLALASKGYYSGNAAMQVVGTLARYATLAVLERYLREIENASRSYHFKRDTVPPPDSLASAYSLSIRTVALCGKGEAALVLVSLAHSRGIRIPDFTLNIAAKQAPDPKLAIDRIRAVCPSWTMQDMNTRPIRVDCETIPAEHTADIAVLAARLRSLRTAIRSSCPPSPRALHNFITSYQSLGRARALPLLRSLACRYSPKSASTWVFTEMLHHRTRRESIHLLFVFAHYFHLVGVPQKTLLSLIRGTRGRQAGKEYVKRWVVSPCPGTGKLWPSAYHTALVWEAIVALSSWKETERLYALLLFLVRKSRRPEPAPSPEPERQDVEADRPRVQLPPDTYDAAHFSPFVSWWARRNSARAGNVLWDMVRLGIDPTVVQWSMVARGYAQHDDSGVALRILDRVEDDARSRARDGDGDGNSGLDLDSSEGVLGAHTNVLRGFVIAGDVAHAREVERRLVERFGYRVGDRPATDASIALLRALEGRLE